MEHSRFGLSASAGAPPLDPRDGERVGASLDQALDSDLSDDQVYHYGIYAIYRTADGQRFPSPGVLVAAIPRSPIPPLSPPRLTLTPGGQVRLDWTEPPRGSVRMLRSARPLPHAPGTQLTFAEAEQLEGNGSRCWALITRRMPIRRRLAIATTLRFWLWEGL